VDMALAEVTCLFGWVGTLLGFEKTTMGSHPGRTLFVGVWVGWGLVGFLWLVASRHPHHITSCVFGVVVWWVVVGWLVCGLRIV
jgi:hypothetical protein